MTGNGGNGNGAASWFFQPDVPPLHHVVPTSATFTSGSTFSSDSDPTRGGTHPSHPPPMIPFSSQTDLSFVDTLHQQQQTQPSLQPQKQAASQQFVTSSTLHHTTTQQQLSGDEHGQQQQQQGLYHGGGVPTSVVASRPSETVEQPKLEYTPFMSPPPQPQGGYEEHPHSSGSPFELQPPPPVTSPKEEPASMFGQQQPSTSGALSTGGAASAGSTPGAASTDTSGSAEQEQQHQATLADYNQSTSKGHEILSQVRKINTKPKATVQPLFSSDRYTNRMLVCRYG